MHHLMIADESAAVRKVGKRILSGMNFQVSESPNALDALTRCHQNMPNILIVDASMNGALELITGVRAMLSGKTVRIYYCVVEADLRKMMLAKRSGADDFLLKPFDRKVLTSVFANLQVAAA